MSTPAFIDTNIFLYAHDRLDREKHETAVRLILDQYRSGTAVISAQVLAEFFQVFVEKMKHPYGAALRELHFMSRCQVIGQDTALVVAAVSLYSRYSLSFWDAMIIAAAIEGSAGILYSEDLQNGAEIDGVRIVNPFTSPHYRTSSSPHLPAE